MSPFAALPTVLGLTLAARPPATDPGADIAPTDRQPEAIAELPAAAEVEIEAGQKDSIDNTTPADLEAEPDLEADPWSARPPPGDHPPSEPAVYRQAGDELQEALNAPKGRGYYAKYASPQRFALELKFGPFLPNVDANYSGADEFGPYTKVFGETDSRGVANAPPRPGLMSALAFEWQFFNPGGLGPLGLGYTFSFFRDRAAALVAEPDPADSTVRSEADSTTFWAMPMALQLVFRLELPADRWGIPIVPYAKGGLNWTLWWSKDGNGDISRNSRDERAIGGVWGWQINTGAMLRLDFLEIGTSRSLDRSTGINHTYIFGEYQLSRVNNFGRPQSMNLGDSTWFVGLAIEF